LPFV
jgi:hypothetical protein